MESWSHTARSDRPGRDVLQQQFVDAVGRLVRGKMADAGKHLEAIGCSDEIDRALGRDQLTP
jgi:hypothetical protein